MELLDLSGLKTALNAISLQLEKQDDRISAIEKSIPHKVDTAVLRHELELMISKEEYNQLKQLVAIVRDLAQDNKKVATFLHKEMLTKKDVDQLCTQEDFVRVENTMKTAKQDMLDIHRETESEFGDVKLILAEMQKKATALAAQSEEERKEIRRDIKGLEESIADLSTKTSQDLDDSISELDKRIGEEIERTGRVARESLADALYSVRKDIDALEEAADAMNEKSKGDMLQIRGELKTTRSAKPTPGVRTAASVTGPQWRALQKQVADLEKELKGIDEVFVTRVEWHESTRIAAYRSYHSMSPQVREVTIKSNTTTSQAPRSQSPSRLLSGSTRSTTPTRELSLQSIARAGSSASIRDQPDWNSNITAGSRSRSPLLSIRARPASAGTLASLGGAIADDENLEGIPDRCLSCDQPLVDGTTPQYGSENGWTTLYAAPATMMAEHRNNDASSRIEPARPRPRTAAVTSTTTTPQRRSNGGAATSGMSSTERKKKSLEDKRVSMMQDRLAGGGRAPGSHTSPTGPPVSKLRKGISTVSPTTSATSGSPLPSITTSKAILSRGQPSTTGPIGVGKGKGQSKGKGKQDAGSDLDTETVKGKGGVDPIAVGLFTDSKTRT